MIIFVLHGFQGATPNRKTEVLRKYAKPHIVVGLNYGYNPHVAKDYLISQIEAACWFHNTRECVFLGTSLGAFWAKFLAIECMRSAILINPALDPVRSLKPHVGVCNNVVTNGAFVLSNDDVGKHANYYNNDWEAPLLILLDRGDELLDYAVTLARFVGVQKCIVYEDGDHSFAHLKEALPDILKFMETSNYDDANSRASRKEKADRLL